MALGWFGTGSVLSTRGVIVSRTAIYGIGYDFGLLKAFSRLTSSGDGGRSNRHRKKLERLFSSCFADDFTGKLGGEAEDRQIDFSTAIVPVALLLLSSAMLHVIF